MDKESKRGLLVVFLIVATELIGFGLIIPILPQLVLAFSVPKLWIGFLLAAYSFAQFFAAPILGGLSDKYGRKPILVISKLGSTISYGILAFSTTYWVFLLARLLDGFTGGNISTARAYVADITKPEERSKGMAIIGISFGLGFVLGPAIGGFLYGITDGWKLPALVSGSLSLIALILTIVLLKEPEKKEHFVGLERWGSFKSVFKNKNVALICLVQLGYMTIFSGFETTFSVFTHFKFNFTAQQNSFAFIFLGILAILIQGYISRKKSARPSMIASLGFGIMGIGLALVGISTQIQTFFLFLTFFSVGISLVNSFLPAALSVFSDPNNQGKVMGIFEGLGSLGRILGPLIAYSFAITSFEPLYVFYGVTLTCFILILMPTTKTGSSH